MARRILLIGAGALAGAVVLAGHGWLIGAAMGYLVALVLELRDEADELADRVRVLELRTDRKAAARLRSAAAERDREGLEDPAESDIAGTETVEREVAQHEVAPPTPAESIRPETTPSVLDEPIAAPAPPRAADREAERAPSVPRRSAAPEPSPSESPFPDPPVLAQAWALLTGGNPLARIGIAMLFVGLVFLIDYAAERGRLSIELRLAATAVAGLALVAGGWLLRRRAAVYAVTLQGGGVAVMYLTVFAAFQLYDVIAPVPALGLLVAIAAFSAVLAIVQNAPVLAVAGALGGFGAPILASTGQGDHVLLFSYYAVLNAGIFAVAYAKAWRSLYLVGFVCTFVIGGVWGGLQYEPVLFATTEPFLILFFALYFAIPLVALRRRAPRITAPLDGSLVFGLPVAAFALQAALVEPFAFGRAWSAFALALVYLGTATALLRTQRDGARPLAEAFFAIGLTFATLTIPFALDAVWSGALWLLEGAALVWTGLRQRRLWLRLAGVGLQLVAVVLLVGQDALAFEAVPLGVRLGGWMAALTLGATAYGLHASERVRAWERRASPLLLALGVALWTASGLALTVARVPDDFQISVLLVFAAASAWAFAEGGRWLRWEALGAWALPGLLGAAYLLLPLIALTDDHPFGHGGWVAWPVVFLALGLVLRRREGASEPKRLGFVHAASLWLLAIVLAWEAAWALGRWTGGEGWAEAGVGVVLTLFVLALVRPPAPLRRWTQPHRAAYRYVGAGGLALALFAWVLLTNAYSPGDPAPLPYLPLLNPFDLAQIAALLVLAVYARALIADEAMGFVGAAPVFYAALSGGAFVAVSGLVARSVHHLAGVSFTTDALLASTLFQTALTITWAVLAMVVMIGATRLRLRTPWLVGAGLLAVVGVKLIGVDLSNAGTLARIVSFVGVGLLVLLIGYFSPAPPRHDEDDPEPDKTEQDEPEEDDPDPAGLS